MSWAIVFHKKEPGVRWINTYRKGDFIEIWPERKCHQLVDKGGSIYKLWLPKVLYKDALRLLEHGKGKRRRKYRLRIRKLPKRNKWELRKTGETEIRINNALLSTYIKGKKDEYAIFIIQ